MLKKLKKEWFLAGMLLAIALSTVVPTWGMKGGILHLDQVTQWGIALIFFLYGINLSPSKIKQGMTNWRLHLLIQLTTFLVYPLIWVVAGHGFQLLFPPALAMGFCYLFTLPSTISSSVAMTSIAKGNVPGAIFNASLSSIIGVIITPMLVELFTAVHGQHIALSDTIWSVTKMLLLPMVVGQLCRPFLSGLINRYKSIINKVDKCVIILIVFNAFSDSMVEHIWSGFSVLSLALCIVICLVVISAITRFLKGSAMLLRFSVEDEAASVFCGTKKTLAAGVPMAKVIFLANPHLGMILLPIMLYHPIQIFYCAMLANNYAKQAEKRAQTSDSVVKNPA